MITIIPESRSRSLGIVDHHPPESAIGPSNGVMARWVSRNSTFFPSQTAVIYSVLVYCLVSRGFFHPTET